MARTKQQGRKPKQAKNLLQQSSASTISTDSTPPGIIKQEITEELQGGTNEEDSIKKDDGKELVVELNSVEEAELNNFVTAAVEKVMGDYWPQPNSEFYCRCCNYLEFENDEDLKEHQNFEDHKFRESNQHEAFCLICQTHTFNGDIMMKHKETTKHIKLLDLFNKAETDAKMFWKKSMIKQEKDQEESTLCGDSLKNKIKEIKKRLQNFFDKNDSNKGSTDDYVEKARLDAMAAEWGEPTTMFFCRICNNISFDSEEERLDHIKTELHKTHMHGFNNFRCKICSLTCTSKDDFKMHKRSEQHRQNNALYNYCQKETVNHIAENRSNAPYDEHSMQRLREQLYPINEDFIAGDACKLCDKLLPITTTINEHKSSKKHQNKLNTYYRGMLRHGMVFNFGCILCNIDEGANCNFNTSQHIATDDHLKQLEVYRETIGLGLIGPGMFIKPDDNIPKLSKAQRRRNRQVAANKNREAQINQLQNNQNGMGKVTANKVNETQTNKLQNNQNKAILKREIPELMNPTPYATPIKKQKLNSKKQNNQRKNRPAVDKKISYQRDTYEYERQQTDLLHRNQLSYNGRQPYVNDGQYDNMYGNSSQQQQNSQQQTNYNSQTFYTNNLLHQQNHGNRQYGNSGYQNYGKPHGGYNDNFQRF